MSDYRECDDRYLCDEVRAERDSLLKRLAWRPIETAPKDEHILTWDGAFHCCEVICWWADDGWVVAWDGTPNKDVTHWMPLPDPPESAK